MNNTTEEEITIKIDQLKTKDLNQFFYLVSIIGSSGDVGFDWEIEEAAAVYWFTFTFIASISILLNLSRIFSAFRCNGVVKSCRSTQVSIISVIFTSKIKIFKSFPISARVSMIRWIRCFSQLRSNLLDLTSGAMPPNWDKTHITTITTTTIAVASVQEQQLKLIANKWHLQIRDIFIPITVAFQQTSPLVLAIYEYSHSKLNAKSAIFTSYKN